MLNGINPVIWLACRLASSCQTKQGQECHETQYQKWCMRVPSVPDIDYPAGLCMYIHVLNLCRERRLHVLCRALRILRTADVIFCEDCRHTRKLLSHYNISTSLQSLHQHNEAKRSGKVVSLLHQGQAVALVSDAGTPGISDPGAITVAEAVAAGCDVVPIPGPCAVCHFVS